MFDKLFILSQRGDTLITKTYKKTLTEDAGNIFADWLREFGSGALLPFQEYQGHVFFHIKVGAIFLVGTTSNINVQPFTAIECLTRIKGLIKDFCGSISEEAIAINRPLIAELLDEVVDFGVIQTTSTKALKPYIQQDATPVKVARQPQTLLGLGPGLFGADFQVAPNTAAEKPLTLLQGHQTTAGPKNEIFIDVLERLNVVLAANGSFVTNEVNGAIQVKTFISGSPELQIGLSEDLVIGKLSQVGYGAHVRVDFAQFHPSANLQEFEQRRVISIQPPDGEFTLMQYGITGELSRPFPFQLITDVQEHHDKQYLDVKLLLQCLLSDNQCAVNIKVHIPVPSCTTDVAPSVASRDHFADFNTKDKKVEWCIKKVHGKTTAAAKLRIHVSQLTGNTKQEVGPINLEFEIKDWTCSQLQVRYLKVFDRQRSYVPLRWVRYVTVSNSYVFRLR